LVPDRVDQRHLRHCGAADRQQRNASRNTDVHHSRTPEAVSLKRSCRRTVSSTMCDPSRAAIAHVAKDTAATGRTAPSIGFIPIFVVNRQCGAAHFSLPASCALARQRMFQGVFR
jgi:hypothetical protein